MKITIEVKDDPRGHPPVKVTIDRKVHPDIHVRGVVSYMKKTHPWAKIIDIRIDLH